MYYIRILLFNIIFTIYYVYGEYNYYVCEEIGEIVQTNVGQIQGNKSDGFIAFLGVPYGVVDESTPFGAATSHPRFNTTYRAVTIPPICPQMVNGTPKGTIQCLHLNIYSPHNVTKTSNLPVIVYIHGGAFVTGDGNINTMSPKFLVKNNVIVVTVMYRLGPYGFLCLPDLGYSNQGLKDIVLALKWVKDNINSFGGDNNNIVLNGHSAGSVAVDFILLFNENNVFNKVIMQSAQAVSPYIIEDPDNETYVAKIAARLGIDTKNMTTEDLMKKISVLDTDLLINITGTDIFRPCVDNIFITDKPKNKKMSDIKIMIGTASNEMLFFYRGTEDKYIDNIKIDLNIGFTNISEYIVDKVKNFYLKGDIKEDVNDFGADYAFHYPVSRSIRYYLKNNATVYRYLFSYDGGHNYMKVRENLTGAGDAHGDELGYLFDMYIPDTERDVADQYVTDAITTLWTNFAKYGNPTPETSDLIPVLWPTVKDNTEYFMNISSSLIVQQGLYAERMAFWDEFYQDFSYLFKGLILE